MGTGVGWVSNWQQARKGLRPVARQVPKKEASAMRVALPSLERVPPIILRPVTRWRNERSAALLVEGTAGSPTKTNSSVRR